MADKIIVYYSRPYENYVDGQIIKLEKGNTELAANIIHKFTGAELFRIEQKVPYSENYIKCTEQAKEDKQNNSRPQLISYPDNIDRYDTVYLGFPNYWGTMPMAVFTFLENCNLNGKIIKPFCTHEGSGFGNSIRDIKALCPESTVKNGIAIHGGNALKTEQEIEKWIKED